MPGKFEYRARDLLTDRTVVVDSVVPPVVACVVSILVRRPLIALTSAAIYRWPPGWYLQDRVRPAYSEITWAWAALHLGKAAVQAVLVVAAYAYVSWRLNRLGAPTVEEWREHPSEPQHGELIPMATHAPDLPTDAVWLNVERPLEPADLRGRVVLLDFWAYAGTASGEPDACPLRNLLLEALRGCAGRLNPDP
ncbi:MAG: hypothetical protein ACRDTT_16960, partial [Pseudonocardiaceae bacterium]